MLELRHCWHETVSVDQIIAGRQDHRKPTFAAADPGPILVHHTHKPAGQKVTAEASRAASALTNAARSVIALNQMSFAEAED